MLELYTVIKNDAPLGEKFAVWKFVHEDFKSGSQLIVNPSEEALFIKDGKIENVFTEGKYTLKTKNYPFIQEFRSFASLGVSAFNCKVYYIDKSDFMDTRWGTSSPIQILNPRYDTYDYISARGSYVIRIRDSEVFFRNYVGSKGKSAITKQDITTNFRSDILEKVKTNIAEFVNNLNEDIVGINRHQEKLAEFLRPKISNFFDTYGIELKRFNIESLDVKPNQVRNIIEEAKGKKIAEVEKAKGQRGVMEILANNWGEQKKVEILEGFSKNTGTGGITPLVFGGAMDKFAGEIHVNEFQPNVKEENSNSSKTLHCCKCGKSIPMESLYCPICGAKQKNECPNCGIQINADSKYCPNCGKCISDNKESKVKKTTRTKKQVRKE